jgi:ribosomal protein S27E
MNPLVRLWYAISRPFRAIGAKKGALLCKVCGETIFDPGDHAAADTSAKAAGAFLGWRCDTCGTRGGFGVES